VSDRDAFRANRDAFKAKHHETSLARAQALDLTKVCAAVQQDNPCELHICGAGQDHASGHSCIDCGLTWERS
jgi:hypothetical protein